MCVCVCLHTPVNYCVSGQEVTEIPEFETNWTTEKDTTNQDQRQCTCEDGGMNL